MPGRGQPPSLLPLCPFPPPVLHQPVLCRKPEPSAAAQGSPAAGDMVLRSSTHWGETLFFLKKNGSSIIVRESKEEKIAVKQSVFMLSVSLILAHSPSLPPVAYDNDNKEFHAPPPRGLLPTPLVAGLAVCLTAECDRTTSLVS